MAGTAAQLTLLGDESQPLVQPERPAAVNDLDLIESTLRAAVHPGYVLGPCDRVARKVVAAGSGVIELVDEQEAAAVRQLIASRHLAVGGSRTFWLDRATVTARSVLVPTPTRHLVSRWQALRPLAA